MKTKKVVMLMLVMLIAGLLAACGDSIKVDNNTPQPNASLKPGITEQSLSFGGRERTYIVHLPPNINSQKNLSLVLLFHGGGGNGTQVLESSFMDKKADKEGFIVVAPNGTGRNEDKLLTWNAGGCCAYAKINDVDDVGFVRVLIEKLQQTYSIDPKRIYATGMSNGGMLSYLLGTELADKLAAIAPVSGSMTGNEKNPSNPISVMAFHGTADQMVPYDGGIGEKALNMDSRKSVAYAMSFWVKNDGANTTPQKEEKGNIIKETYTGGKNGTEVVLYTVKGGGHAWPGGAGSRIFGDKPTNEISATDLMWDFFTKHPKQ